MIKGTSKNVFCDGCHGILYRGDMREADRPLYVVVCGKKRTLRYHPRCVPQHHQKRQNKGFGGRGAKK